MAVIWPGIDWVFGDLVSVWRSARNGAAMGAPWGAVMYFLEPWIRRRFGY